MEAGAKVIFSGQVIAVAPLGDEFSEAVARFQVARLYQGASALSELKFSRMRFSGHNCIDFEPGTNWIVFATEDAGHLTLVDDCYGALPVSHQLAPLLDNASSTAQMEADFAAGLSDSDSEGRIYSIQRLGKFRIARKSAGIAPRRRRRPPNRGQVGDAGTSAMWRRQRVAHGEIVARPWQRS
jgi:hypothetical protein